MCSIPGSKTPASHTTQEWMRRLYIRRCCQCHIHLSGTSSTFCTVSTSTLPAPLPIPLRAHQRSFEKLAANSVQLIFMGTSCCLTRRSWEGPRPCVGGDGELVTHLLEMRTNQWRTTPLLVYSMGRLISIFIFKLGILSYYVHGDEVNCIYSECPEQHLCRRGDGYIWWIHFSCLHVLFGCGETKRPTPCRCSVCVGVETLSAPGNDNLTQRRNYRRCVWNTIDASSTSLSDTLHAPFEIPLAAAWVHSLAVSSLQSALYSTVC